MAAHTPRMALTLALADNADGTGLLATVAGSLGTPVAVHYTPADRPWPGDAWAIGGTRTGDGTLAVALPPRFYFVYAATSTAVTPPERIAVTSGEESVAERVQAAVVAVLKLADLPRVGDGVHNQVLLDPTAVKYPCAVVYLENLSEGEERSTNGTDDIVYPMSIILLDTGVSRTRHSHKAWVQACREKISRALRNVHLAGVPESVVTRVMGGPIAQERVGAAGLPVEMYAGGFQVRVTCREPRGLGA